MEEESNLTPQVPYRAKRESAQGWQFIKQIGGVVVLALVLAIFSMQFILRAYEVDGASMESTLQNGDRLVVWKATKYWYNIRGKTYIPDRWDIVVFDRPLFVENSSGTVDHLIKRVIGLPGDRVVVSNGEVSVHPSGDESKAFNPDEDQEYTIANDFTPGDVDIIVGENEIFVLGDNRTNSLDSRRFGSVNVSHITGVAEIRIAPVDSMQRF